MTKNITFSSTYLEKIPIESEIIEILGSAFSSVDPVTVIKEHVHLINSSILRINNSDIRVDKYNKIYLFGLGKASQLMTLSIKEIIGNFIEMGVVLTKHSNHDLEPRLLPEITTYEGSHPIPTLKSIQAAESAIKRIGKLDEKDLVISLISGGGSSLAVLLKEGVTLEDYQQMTRLLLDCGASIQEINTIRKQIDRIKGGGLLQIFYPAQVISLILSDVVGDPLDVIASGPTVPSNQTEQDALSVINKYDLGSKIPTNIRTLLEKGVNEEKRLLSDEISQKVDNILIGNNKLAAQAAKKTAEDLGFQAEIVSTTFHGEARVLGAALGKELKKHIKQKQKRASWIYGGETTVTIHGNGKGGRNQEFILAAAQEIAGLKGGCILSIATDGEDGPTDAAGAVADGSTIAAGTQLGLNADVYLQNNDAYSYLDAVGSLIRTGASGTNVNDLVFLFTY